MAVFLVVSSAVGWAEDRPVTDEQYEAIKRANILFISVRASTWMPRGHTLYDAAATLRTKLAAAGFAVVPEETQTHELVLKVVYREERGQQIRFDMFGTDISAEILLEHTTAGPLLEMTIRESSSATVFGTPPYLDALQKFETNPYYYFLGDIVRARVASRLDITGGLIQGLRRVAQRPPERGDQQEQLSMRPTDELYASDARENTIRELGRLKDRRAVPILTAMLEHPDGNVRLRSAESLGMIGAPESRPALERVAQHDRDPQVRKAAAGALSSLPAL
jgi:hypothetical protein